MVLKGCHGAVDRHAMVPCDHANRCNHALTLFSQASGHPSHNLHSEVKPAFVCCFKAF